MSNELRYAIVMLLTEKDLCAVTVLLGEVSIVAPRGDRART